LHPAGGHLQLMIFSIADRNQEALEGTADELSDRPTVRTLGLLTNKRAHHANVVQTC